MDEIVMSKVYIKTDPEGYVVAVNGGYTTPQDLTGWIYIDSGEGDKYNLCQSNYFDYLFTEDGLCAWKYENGKCVKRSDDELNAERAEPHKAPLSEIDMLKKQVEAQNEMLDFYEECIAEMAAVVYA